MWGHVTTVTLNTLHTAEFKCTPRVNLHTIESPETFIPNMKSLTTPVTGAAKNVGKWKCRHGKCEKWKMWHKNCRGGVENMGKVTHVWRNDRLYDIQGGARKSATYTLHKHISGSTYPNVSKHTCMLPMAVAQSISGSTAIHYVLQA